MKKESSQKSSEIIKKNKERHIVTWSQQEDDILREQISIHGTENWTIIASKFKDKTTRQCRRRWYTYLNSDFKKGGWSPEEDMLLCEAQKIFGNRWTEIAKVVSGRTDNAVKNRFTTLCKKRAKHQDTILKENKSFRINQNNKRVIFQNGFVKDGASESAAPLKKMRTHISDVTEVCNPKGRLFEGNKQLRPPFAVIVQNSQSVCDLPSQQHVSSTTSTGSNDAATGKNNDQGMFLKRDDPKLTFLMQQAELLSSLAAKVNEENNNQSLENAWKELHDFLNRAHESDLPRNNVSEEDFRLEDLKNLIEDWKISTPGSHLYWRESDFHKESPRSPGYSTESTLQSDTIGEITEQPAPEVCSLQQSKDVEPQSVRILVENYGAYSWDEFSGTSDANIRAQLIHTEEKSKDNADHSEGFDTVKNVSQVVLLPSMDEPADKDTFTSSLPNMEFSSPLQVTPLFRTLAAGIPSPKFSESERNFLLKTLGQESLSPNPSQPPPPCKRALLHSL